MTKFQVIQAINGVSEYSQIIFEVAKRAKTADALEKSLLAEIPKETVLTLMAVARTGAYPLSTKKIIDSLMEGQALD